MRQKEELADRVARAAQLALAQQHFVSPLDVLLGIGWVDGGTVKRWQKGQIDCLEAVLQARPTRIVEAMRLLRAWAQAHELWLSEAPYPAATPRREALRFSATAPTRRPSASTARTGSRPSCPQRRASAWMRKSRARARAGGDHSVERYVDLPSLRRDRRISG